MDAPAFVPASDSPFRGSDDSYRAIFELSHDAIFVHDPDTGAILDANRRACELVGLSLSEMRRTGVSAISHGPSPFTPAQALKYIYRAATGSPEHFEWVTMHPVTGAELWSEINLQRISIKGEDRVVAVVREIGERKRAEQALRESEESYRTIFQHSSDAIWVHDMETGALIDVNQAGCEMYGYTVEEQKALGHDALLYPGSLYTRDRVLDYMARAAAGETPRFEWMGRHRDGSPVWGEVTLRRVSVGGQDRILASVRDIRERKQAEEALRRANEQLEQRVAERTGELAAANEALLARTQELEAVFQALPDLYFRLRADGTIVEQRAGRDNGGRYHLAVDGFPTDMVGLNVLDVLPAEASGTMRDALAKVPRSEELVCFEFAVPIKGELRHSEARILPLANGELIVIVRDITERIEVEDALRRSEEHFRALIQNASDVIVIMGHDGTLIYQSPALERQFGYAPGDLPGTSVWESVHPDDRAGTQAEFGKLARKPGETPAVEFRFRTKDGHWRYVEAIGRTLTDDAPQHGIVVTVRDVSDRKQVEAELIRQKAYFEQLLDSTDSGIVVFGPDTCLEYVSPSAITDPEMREWVIGKTNREYSDKRGVPREITEQRQRGLERAVAERKPNEFEQEMRNPDGSVSYMLRRVVPVLDDAGEVVRIIGYSVNITDRKRAEHALQHSEEHFRRMIENASDMVQIVAADSRIVYTGPSVQRLLGYTPEEIADTSAFTYLHPDDVPATSDAFTQMLANPGIPVSTEYRVRHKNGNWRDFEAKAMTLSSSSAEAGVVLNARDITDRKAAEEALRQAKEEAERANRAKSEFLSRMSHELRTPMNGILGFAQLLERRGLAPEEQKYVGHILKGGQHLLRLINEVLEIARIEAGRLSLSLEPVQLGSVLREGLDMVRPMAAEAQIEFDTGSCTESDVFVFADRQRLAQVLLNLLSNAIKYNRPGGRVRVFCEASLGDDQRLLRVRVQDTGRGIPEDRADQLFTPFARLGAEQTPTEGTGLGLALSQRLAEVMGGSLALEKTSPEGSVFRLELRATASPLPQIEGRAGPAASSGEIVPAPATILYIEDNVTNLTLVEAFLESQPRWRTISALQGQAGVELAREQQPDLILLDLHLPDISGDEVLRRLRADERTAGIPVVVISADATRSAVDRLRAAGAKGYLTKPIDLDEFLATVAQYLPGEGVDGEA